MLMTRDQAVSNMALNLQYLPYEYVLAEVNLFQKGIRTHLSLIISHIIYTMVVTQVAQPKIAILPEKTDQSHGLVETAFYNERKCPW